jgi:ribosomal protein S18 acetylase RimI-like enzyme
VTAHDGLVLLSPDDLGQVQAAAALHAELLGHSPIPRLGGLFMRRFFYSTLVRDGLVRSSLYRSGGRYVGFLSITEKPFTFMSEGRRKHMIRLALVLGVALLARPARIAILWEILRRGGREMPPDPDRTGEILSIGVLPDARGTGAARELLEEGLRHLRRKGFACVEFSVDCGNDRAIAFYRAFGATVRRSRHAWPSDCRGRIAL